MHVDININQPVTERLAWVISQYAHRLALKSPRHELTYAGLNAATNRISHALLRRLGHGSEPVASLLGPGIWPVVANHGILKAGKFYVELDASYPRQRSAMILHDSGARAVLTDTEHWALATELIDASQQLINLDEIWTDPPADDPRLPLTPDHIACLIYTSGSTGKPKGVIATHRGILDRVRHHVRAARHGPEERFLGIGSRAADWKALLTGAALLVFDVKAEGFRAAIDWMQREKVMCLNVQTAGFRGLIQTVQESAPPGAGLPRVLPDVRLAIVGGERIHGADILAARSIFAPTCEFITGYSMTETGPICHHGIAPDELTPEESLPVGHPVDGKEVLVLGADGQRLPAGEYGDLAVRSDTLALGYWNLPDETRARFLPDPDGGSRRLFLTGDRGRLAADGCLELRGRSDFMVKIRGARVELEEVENALRSLNGVRQAAVIARSRQDAASDDVRLVAYLVAAPGQTPTVTQLYAALQQRLPTHAIPARFVFLDSLPTTPSGKIDRAALPHPDRMRPHLDIAFVPPRTPLETWLAQQWADVLGLDQIGVQDPFLHLGGHSLLATQIIARVAARFDAKISAGDLLAAPTVERMALVILRRLADDLEPSQLQSALDA